MSRQHHRPQVVILGVYHAQLLHGGANTDTRAHFVSGARRVTQTTAVLLPCDWRAPVPDIVPSVAAFSPLTRLLQFLPRYCAVQISMQELTIIFILSSFLLVNLGITFLRLHFPSYIVTSAAIVSAITVSISYLSSLVLSNSLCKNLLAYSVSSFLLVNSEITFFRLSSLLRHIIKVH